MLSISMDSLAKNGYKNIKPAQGKLVNTVDAVLVDKNNEWYLIEFKDCMISQKDNIKKRNGQFFKDAYVYTEEYFKRRFVQNFEYE